MVPGYSLDALHWTEYDILFRIIAYTILTMSMLMASSD